MISVPRPIDIELKQLTKNVWMHEAEPDGVWPFSYIVARGLRDKEGAPFTSNLSNGTNHATAKAALGEVQSHFAQCVSRCYVAASVQPIIEMARRKSTGVAHEKALDALEGTLEGTDAKVAQVVPLPLVKTRGGIQVTPGGFGYPWPFTYLLVKAGGDTWTIHGHEEAGELSLDGATAWLNAFHDDRIDQLINGMTARKLAVALNDLTLDGVDALVHRLRGEEQQPELEMGVSL